MLRHQGRITLICLSNDALTGEVLRDKIQINYPEQGSEHLLAHILLNLRNGSPRLLKHALNVPLSYMYNI